MAKPSIRIHDLKTNEVIDREMTDEEFKIHKSRQEESDLRKAEAEAKATAKTALLSKLGITAEEAVLLLS